MRAYNLNKLCTKIPLGKMVCIAGVSGSGKSTLVNHVLYEGLSVDGNEGNGTVTTNKDFDEVILIDQSTVTQNTKV